MSMDGDLSNIRVSSGFLLSRGRRRAGQDPRVGADGPIKVLPPTPADRTDNVAIAGKLVYGELSGEKVPTALTLGTIAAVLAVSIGASVLKERRELATATT